MCKARDVALLAAKGRQACIGFLGFLEFLEILVETLKNTLNLVKIILKKTAISFWHCESGSFATQNSRFYLTKPTLLECQTIGFTMR